jgi:hypothetical protein
MRTIFRVLAPALLCISFTGILFGKSSSSLTLISSLNPSPLGGFVTFTAQVSPLTATGTVTFTDGSTTLGTGTISSGTASYSLQTLAAGSHSISASYGGDKNNNSSVSPTLTQTVNKQNTTVTLASSANPSIYGASVTFNAAGLPLAANGSVTFKDGSTALATVPISFGSATYSTTGLAGGVHSMTATYGGDSSDNPSTSSTLTQTVNPASASVALTSSANPTSAGSMLTFTATVAPSAATGTVTFMDGSTALGTGAIGSGTATYSTWTLAAGSHPLTASYGGNANYSSGTSATLMQTVTAANTTLTLTSSASPSPYGSPVTFTATVTPPIATGSVTFKDGSTTLGTGTISSGTATYSTSTLVAGQHSITASYAGNVGYNSSVSPTLTETVSQVGTTVALASSANPSLYGSSVTFTATVTPTTATGTVTFKDGSTTLGTSTIGSGTASYSISTLAVGSHSVAASYSGDTNYNSSSSAILTQAVNQASTAVALTSSANPSLYGSSVTFTATVTPSTATGTVTFMDGGATLGTGTISSGKATYSTSALVGGSHSVTGAYGGDGNYNASTSLPLTQTTNQANTTVTLTSSSNPSLYGSSVTFSATVTPPTATGTVTFADGSTTLGTGTISGGKAIYSTSTLAGGSHSVTGAYGGDGNYNASTSLALAQTVKPSSSSVALSSSANPSTYSSSVTFTATVLPSAATGTVTFKDGTTTLGTGTISVGIATYSTSSLAVKLHSITAAYGGDTNDSASTSPTLTQTVNQASSTVALTSSANPSSYGSPVTFTATVTPSTATGTVTFLDGATTLGTGTFTSGTATYSTSKLAVGPHSISASYGGDTNDSASIAAVLTQAITPANTTVSLKSSANPSSYSSTVTFTATVTPSTATGTATFLDGSTTLGTGTIQPNGTATYSTSALTGGPHSITASYGGDPKDNGSTSSVLTQTVNPATTTVTVASSANPSTYGALVTFTATVKQSASTGTVTFMDGGTTLGTGTISGGKATYSTSTLVVGSHSLTAAYGGDNNYSPSTSLNVTQTVKPATSSVALSSSANPSAYGFSVTFTATVTPSVSTGTATFKDGSTMLGTGTISGGIATYSTSALAVKSHSITAAYGGDTNDSASTSPILTQTVTKATTTVALTSSVNPSAFGSSATFTVTITPATATGTVTFLDGTTTLGTGAISNGAANYSTSALALGSHSITASYGGDTNDSASISATLTQTVDQASPTVTLTSSANPSTYGASVKFTAAVSPTNVTGTVTFMDGSTTLGTGTISSGKTTYSTSALAVGTHAVTAVYGGDGNHSSSTSSVLTQTVKKATSSIAVSSSANPSSYGASVTFTATLTPGSETGVVTFKDGSTTLGTGTISSGIATYTTTALTVGQHSITASYGGDANFNGSTPATVTQSVNQAGTTVTLTSSANPSAYGSSAIFTATVTPATATGTVTFRDGSTTLGTGAISNGSATYSSSVLALGLHPITASYGGDTNDSASASPTLTQTVNQVSTTTTLTSSTNPSAYGSPVTFTATVTPPTATGTVTFTDGSTTLGTGTISSGTATYSTSALAIASHPITASYGGDTNDSASGSTTLTQAVNQVNTTVSLTSSANPAFGTPVTFTATVTPATATGTVTFTDGNTTLGTAAISSGTATYSIATPTPGSHAITASYGGDTSDSSSVSAVLTEIIATRPILVTTSLPAGIAGSSYSATLTVNQGTPAYNWSISNGTLPAGLSLDANAGAITGIPTSGGTSNFTVKVTDANSLTATQALSIVVSASLNTSRYEHSATLLNGGQILVAGGIDCPTAGSCTYLNSAELYDPGSSLFTSTGTLTTARSAPAVLLTNGKVLVAGGYSCDGSGNCSSLSSAEIYDPAAGTFSSAGTMTAARSDHTMTVLLNGTVLVAGGQNCTSATSCSALSSAEIYDPKAETFTSTSSVMSAARFGASAVLLNSGSVLIAGGFDGTNLPAAAEIYSPASGFTGTGASLNVPRFDSSATLLNSGQVLVVGGSTCILPGCPSNAAEIYDPVANTFTNVAGGLAVRRFNHSATLLSNGGVLVAGGYSSCGSSCSSEASAELFDPVAGKFSSGQPLATARVGHTATRLASGNVFISGGINAGVTLATDEWYQPVSLTPAGLSSLTVAPTNALLMPGQTEQLVATGTFNDGSTQTLQSVTWSSSNPSVASISNSTGSAGIAAAQAAGANTLTATAGAVSGSASLNVVNQASTLLTSSTNPSAFGAWVTFTANLTPATATGTVTFADGSTTLGTATISNGTATYSISTLAAGPHSITASYSGDTNDSSNTSAVLTQEVITGGTTVTLTSSANPLTVGSPVTLTANLTPVTATGTVTFADGSTTLGTGTVSNGKATFSTSTLGAGSHAITASYSGDTNDGSGTSSVLTETINQASTTVTLTSSANPSAFGLPATFTATVTPATATGAVTFVDGSTTLGTGTVSNGSATYNSSTLAVGSHSITASYGGDTNDGSSTSSTLTETVNRASTTVTLTSTANPSAFGSSTTFKATVTPSTATGTVTFADGGTTLGTATISDGSATYSTSTLTVGSHSTTASYGGDINDSGSTSTILTQTVSDASTAVALASSESTAAFGSQVTFTATVTPATATGTVTFADSSTTLGSGTISSGSATYSTSALAVGAHPITASYSGDSNDNSSASLVLTQTIEPIPQVVTASLSAATLGISYSATLAATAGTPPYSWSLNSGSLPTGLSLNTNTGAITGTPTVENASNFTVQVTDANSITATQPLSIVVYRRIPQLPLVWVDNNEATDGLVYTPPTYEYILGANSWVTGPPPGCSFSLPYAVTAAGKQAAINALEACRTATGQGSILDVPPGILQSANGIVIPQTNTAQSNQFIIIRSTQEAALAALGEPVCAGGTQDNVSASTAPGLINPDCAGDNLAYQLGTTVTPVPQGAFTFANGTVTNTSAYNFHQYMYEDQCTANGCVALQLCSNTPGSLQTCGGSTAIGPDHWLFEDGAAAMSPGNTGNNDVVSCGSGTPTALSQYAYHIHFRRYWSHGDWTSLAAGTNQVSSAFSMANCGYSSIVGSQVSQSLRPGSEGHTASLNGPGPYKIDHNWFEGQSSSVFIGGFSVTPPIAGFVPANDVEIRRNRFTFPYGWLGQSPISGNPNYTNSVARKNCLELKEGQRIVLSGNICENVDNSGGQNGAVAELIVRNKSAGAGGQNYQSVISDVTIVDAIYRNACRDMSIAARSASAAGNGGGVSETMARVWFDNVLHYGISSSSPGCPGGNIGMLMQSNGASWSGTITENSSGTQAQFVATCSVDGGDCPHGPPSPGFEVMNINAGDPVSISGCTVTAFNSPTHTACGKTGASGIGPKATSGSAPWSGSYNVAGVTVTYPWTAPPNTVDNSGSCRVTNLESGPQSLLITHNSFITDIQNSIGSGPAPSAGPSFQTNHLFRDSIILSGNNPRGWNNSPCGEGTPTENFDYDTTTMTADHLVLPTRAASSYTEFGNHPYFSNPFCSAPNGCIPPLTFQFPTTDYCTGSTATPACVGFTGAMSLPAGPMPVTLPDYHGYVLRPDSAFHGTASDGSDLGVNIPAIDAAQATDLYVCTSFCGTPGPFPD